jgi:hypothetical protein
MAYALYSPCTTFTYLFVMLLDFGHIEIVLLFCYIKIVIKSDELLVSCNASNERCYIGSGHLILYPRVAGN